MELKTLTGEIIDLTTLGHDSMIIIRGIGNGPARQHLVEQMQKVIPVSAAILVFGNQENAGLEIVPEKRMNELGWYRSKWKDRMARFIHRLKKQFPSFGLPEYARSCG